MLDLNRMTDEVLLSSIQGCLEKRDLTITSAKLWHKTKLMPFILCGVRHQD